MPFTVPFEAYDFPAQHATDGKVDLGVREARAGDCDTWRKTWLPRFHAANRIEAGWPWVDHIERAAVEANRLCLAVTRQTGELEALLSLSVERSRLVAGLDVIYIEYVGTVSLGASPFTPKLGSLLVLEAMVIADENGFEGRVGLHSKGGKLDDWYARLGFTPCTSENTGELDENNRPLFLLYFEAAAEEAQRRLEGRKL